MGQAPESHQATRRQRLNFLVFSSHWTGLKRVPLMTAQDPLSPHLLPILMPANRHLGPTMSRNPLVKQRVHEART